MPPRVLVFGSVNVDLVVTAASLPAPGETVLGTDFQQIPGGKGANQAVAAARAALESGWVEFHASLGTDSFGGFSLQALLAEGLPAPPLRQLPGVPTGVALIAVDARGQNQIAVAPGANATWTAADWDSVPPSLFQHARVFLASLEVPLPAVVRGLQLARAAGLTTILNPAPAHRQILDRELLTLVDLLTPNETELALLAGQPCSASSPPEPFQLQQWAVELRRWGCGAVLATLGPQGCLLVSAHETWAQPAFSVPVVDTTAAGDAFNGALAIALAEGVPLAQAARFASATAALSVGRAGAQPSLPARREIEAFLASHAASD
ncbi:MAG: ribokinase [Planctomycetaceae bacterium]